MDATAEWDHAEGDAGGGETVSVQCHWQATQRMDSSLWSTIADICKRGSPQQRVAFAGVLFGDHLNSKIKGHSRTFDLLPQA